MFWILSYDVSASRLRNRIITICKNYGFVRMQKSVFSAEASPERIDELQTYLKEAIIQEFRDKDSLIIIPISADPRHLSIIIGSDVPSPQTKLPEYYFV